jgi:hypothetical protein
MMETIHEIKATTDAALEALHQRYFWLHLGAQSVCSALFVTGSTLMLFETTKPAASWIFLAGSLTFAALPTIRLLNEKAKNAHRRPEQD